MKKKACNEKLYSGEADFHGGKEALGTGNHLTTIGWGVGCDFFSLFISAVAQPPPL